MVYSDPSRSHSSSVRSPRAALAGPRTFCFSVQAAAEPGVMPRVLQLFAKRNLVPERWVSDVDGQGALSIDVQVAGLTPDVGAYIARCLRQIADVRAVLTSEKAGAG